MSALTFREAITRAGLLPPADIEPGKIHRIPGVGKGPSNDAGWCLLFPGGQGGVFGDWSSGLHQKWRASRPDGKPICAAEQRAFAKQYRQATAERKRIHQAEQSQAAERASKLYAAASKVIADHGYLVRKCITAPPLLRQTGDRLLIPMFDASTNKLRGLQSISADGEKRFTTGMAVRGCIFTFLGEGDGPLLVCEGFATGASLSGATGWHVVCSFAASNLPLVASMLRRQYPQREMLIAADNDHDNERAGRGNAGLDAGRKAARAVCGLLVAPPPHTGKDWNDFAQANGNEKLDAVLRKARATVTDASEPKTVAYV